MTGRSLLDLGPPERAVTVVIPTRDRFDLVRRSLGSALAQEGVAIRVIVVDDGSTAATARALDGLVGPDVEVVHHARSLGVAGARNAGIMRAITPWVAFLDDDDYWAPDKLRSQLEALEGSGADWSCVGAIHINGDLRPLQWQEPPRAEEILDVLSRRGGIPGGGSGVLAATELARRIGGFDPSFSIFADWDFYYRLGLASESAAPVNRPLVAYYRHSDSMFNDVEGLAREVAALDRKYRGGAEPMRLDWADWALQILVMALRSRDPLMLVRALGSVPVRRAPKARLLRAAIERVRAQLGQDKRACPAHWRAEPLTWLLRSP